MSELILDEIKIKKAMKWWLLSVSQLAVEKISDIAPRDKERMPKDPSQKVTWNLKRSIWFDEVGDLEFDIGVAQGDEAENYAWHQEFWTVHMEARSYLRKGIVDNADEFTRQYAYVVQQLLR